jgi:hypothetical protein
MLVEVLFWFHPLVWWIGRRLVEERERACDETVLAAGNAPLVYAQSILKVCRYYVQMPLVCAPGMSGPDLNVRLTAIMRGGEHAQTPPGLGLLLASLGATALMLPIAAGMLGTMPVTPIAAKMETVLNTALPMIVPQLAPPAPRPAIAHHRAKDRARVRVASFIPAPAPAAAALQPVVTMPPPAAVQPPVIVSVIHPTAPVLPADPAANELVCRRPQILPGSRLPGPTICKPQSEWAQLKARGLDVAPDGRIYGLSDYEKARTLAARSCPGVAPGASTAGNWIVGVCI